MKATSDGIFSTHHIIISMMKRPGKLPGFGTHNAIINICLLFPPLDGCLDEVELEEGRQLRRREQHRSTSINSTTVRKQGSCSSASLLYAIRRIHCAPCQLHLSQDALLPWLLGWSQEIEKSRTTHGIVCLAMKRTAPNTLRGCPNPRRWDVFVPLLTNRFSEAYCIHEMPQEAMSGTCYCVR